MAPTRPARYAYVSSHLLTMPATLRFAHLSVRLRAWLAVWLIAFASLSPTVTQALAAAQGPGHGMEVCTSSGPRTLDLDGSNELAVDVGAPHGAGHPQPGSLAGGHCPLCLLSHGGLVPPPATLFFVATQARSLAPPWPPLAAPVSGAHQRAAAPRGPPGTA
jgi:Protein of unknown function (DUF2946)